ncbi:hypothetical protein ABB37_02392 [Leptomonas pyrrhocoris]|uniref:Uncharacterized protein n=1 Tax=Leptomonas pyrrhocoris TaxID=157538 RepID=A0A0N0DYR2_LEPPY|nr:hypothetical protein ABB37_02392 [Leptomonas pyrrhocoris]KPA84415.1 hypothetical protein ABB37_02392 [Leptomonas pyrrhocoris]|eukprot:XP_015662854.1 hypothetical protein ABB37_02392 [Leptomonas pyrrhocoris]
MQSNGNYMQMQAGGLHPQQMEWLMQQQRMQGGSPQAVSASRAYHLEPMNVPQQQQQQQGQLSPHSSNAMMNNGVGGAHQYGPMGMLPPQQQMGMGGYGGPNMMMMAPQGGNGAAYAGANFGGTPSPLHNNNGGEAGAGEWNQVNFQNVFSNAADPQTQQNVFKLDDGKPLPFPPGHLLAQYPPDYQQQMVFYYRLLRLQYPELYQQYVDYYNTFYEPLYNPPAPTPEVKERRAPPPKKKNGPPPPQQQQRPTPPPQTAPPPQPMQPLPPPVQGSPQKKQEGLQRSNSNVSSGLTRQSSLRRQNSMRRAEVNHLKNEGGLKRLPSMHQS